MCSVLAIIILLILEMREVIITKFKLTCMRQITQLKSNRTSILPPSLWSKPTLFPNLGTSPQRDAEVPLGIVGALIFSPKRERDTCLAVKGLCWYILIFCL